MENPTTVAIWLIKKLCIDTNATKATLTQDVIFKGESIGTYKITVEKLNP